MKGLTEVDWVAGVKRRVWERLSFFKLIQIKNPQNNPTNDCLEGAFFDISHISFSCMPATPIAGYYLFRRVVIAAVTQTR